MKSEYEKIVEKLEFKISEFWTKIRTKEEMKKLDSDD